MRNDNAKTNFIKANKSEFKANMLANLGAHQHRVTRIRNRVVRVLVAFVNRVRRKR